MNDEKQQDLFPENSLAQADTPLKRIPLTRESSIQAALGLFEVHMRDEGLALNTVKAFASDIRLVGKYLGIGQPVGEISTKNLNDYLNWLQYERGVPCSPKSYARRVTTVKVFFKWLHEMGVIASDPALPVIQQSVSSPVPMNLPGELEVQQALKVTEAMRQGVNGQKPDARPHLLLTLLLKTGIKKGEVMAIVPNHIDSSNAQEPVLFVRYANPQLRYKERKLPLEPSWLEVLDEYLRQYKPHDTLFTCTARNLEYILTDVGEACGLEQGVISFENLRWVSALWDWQQKVEPDEIRQKLGLSKITWREMRGKLEQLANQLQ